MAFEISAGALFTGGASILGGLLGSGAASNAAGVQAQSGQASNALQKAIYDQTREDNAGTRMRGEAAGNSLAALMAPGGQLTQNFSAGAMGQDPQYAQLQPLINSAMQRSQNFQTSPGYQFRTDQGNQAVTNNMNASGGSYSGATLKALQRFGQDNASAEYGNWMNQSNQDRNFIAGQGQDAFNRFTGNQDRSYNRLAGVAGTGQTATNNVNAAGSAYGQSAGNTLQGIGNAQASGIVGGANAFTNAGQQGINNYQQNSLMNMLQNRMSNNSSLYRPEIQQDGYDIGQGGAYGGNRAGM